MAKISFIAEFKPLFNQRHSSTPQAVHGVYPQAAKRRT
jgi:hypothetical protein